MVADLVQRQVAVIVIPNTTGSALAAKAATEYNAERRNRTRVVFSFGADAPCAAESWVERGESAAAV